MHEASPDVIALQETMCGGRTFPQGDLEACGYDVVHHGGEGGRGGVALLSRVGFDDVVKGISGAVAPLDEPRSISATCGSLRVHTAYAPNGRKVGTSHHQIKLAWFSLFGEWLSADGLGEMPTLVMGDLNIAPTDADIWEPSRYRKRNLTSPPERRAFEALLDRGLRDLVRAQAPNDRLFTWWNRRSDFFETDRGWRLDHALGSPDVANRLENVWIERAVRAAPGSSDHAPLLVQLRDE